MPAKLKQSNKPFHDWKTKRLKMVDKFKMSIFHVCPLNMSICGLAKRDNFMKENREQSERFKSFHPIGWICEK